MKAFIVHTIALLVQMLFFNKKKVEGSKAIKYDINLNLLSDDNNHQLILRYKYINIYINVYFELLVKRY